MKNQPKLLAVLTAAALSAGCASGGGSGGGGGNDQIDTQEEAWLCFIFPIFCLTGAPASGLASNPAASSSAAKLPFTTWSDLARGAETEAKSLTTGLSYQNTGPISATSVPGIAFAEATERAIYPSSGATATTPADIGQPGIEVRQQENPSSTSQTPFTSLPGQNVAVIANPYVLGWEYQSFGVWNNQGSSTGAIRASTFGAPTPALAVPTSGSATFSGKLAGLYVSPAGQGAMAAADLNMNANFSTRSLTFSSSGTNTTHDAKTPTAAPNLNLNGTLTYAPGSNSFTGTLVNSSGTMSGSSNGRFYGPAAQELGGVFTVKSATSVETFIGAYGAKR